MKRHISGFDYLRVVAIFSVVWIHGCDVSPTLSWLNGVNGYAVPCFIMMSIFLAVQSMLREEPHRATYLKRRAQRLLVPLLVWSFAYCGARYAKSIFLSGGVGVDWNLLHLIKGGASYQLWFLPALFLYQLIILLELPLLRLGRVSFLIVCLVCVSFSTFVATSDWLAEMRGGFDFLSLYYLPFVFMGMFCVWLVRELDEIWLKRMLGALIFSSIITMILGVKGYGVLAIYSLSAFFSAQIFDLPKNRAVVFLSANSMGIYLLHGFFLEGGQACATLLKIDLSQTLYGGALIIGSYTLSVVTSGLLGRFAIIRNYGILG